ncbi:G-type lectin S-receptor-like serine/threonine-protein kinase At4g03230 isoform X2 [Vicia villosa]|uniref:G-type lectin S-receptor-like serine/threonine-protein kinase At4g03230 isoform X2 n=1 Tax=Vicia villosa TaxID=3911 RepID=UPI00273CD03C|nr:G-type lectin S-receptor-like serine/threonine-protein kinase At4g03230 isoform X2 [Vicia villosa]
MSSNMRTVFLFFNLYTCWLLICSSQLCLAGDTLSAGKNITGDETIVSSRKVFELGFFTPSINGGGLESFLGIWYHIQDRSREQPQKPTVVWVANRDKPIAFNATGVFKIAEDGNLVVEDTSGNNNTYWSSNFKSKVKFSSNSSPKNKTMKLLDSGNLVLYDDENMVVKLWESFENPTDTFLPGMKMDRNLKLTSWKGDDDPGSGNFSFKMERIGDTRFVIMNRDQIYWESEEYGTLNFQVNNHESEDISSVVYSLLTNLSLPILNNTRLLLNSTGVIQWVDNSLQGESLVRWKQPNTKCLTYNVCGNFASCNDNDKVCKCLPGFNTDLLTDSSLPDKAGCTRRKSAPCTTNDTVFLNLNMIKTGRPDIKFAVEYEESCKNKCLEMCPQCQAYSYAPLPTDRRRTFNPSNCWIWTHNLTTLKEDYTNWDPNRRLIVLVDKSDIATTPRTCEPCGSNPVPYPLSTGPNCGDPTYFNFRCNPSMGQLSFTNDTTSNNISVNYRVIRVAPSSKTFTIYNEDNTFNQYCGEGSQYKGSLKISPPFRISSDNLCYEQVVISWNPPSEEPICDNSADCHGWNHSTCSKGNRCLCNANYYWSGESLNCTEMLKSSTGGKSKSSFYLILGLVLTGTVTLACIIVFAYACRRRIAHMIKKDPTKSVILDWQMRFDIVLGIARGLLYLHQDSRLRVIHRDLKTSNILLDEDMQPKISDFGLARIFGGKETEASTERVVGTYGYMSPEYALDGYFSTKSDVFSFGVVLLEIISGKRNTGFYRSKEISSLLGYAWRLWREEKLQDLIDPSLHDSYNENQFLRCSQIGLSCVQDEPDDRPHMSNVVTMLDNETTILSIPKQPTFFTRKDISSTASSSQQYDATIQEGR